MHLTAYKYEYWDCTKRFHTDHDRLNHMNSVHHSNIYHCTVCSFSALVESRICLLIRMHLSKKFTCHMCDAQLSSKVTLHRHALLHAVMGEHQYAQCDKSYASRLVLSIHMKGIHGPRYKCPNCDKVFDALIKKAWHLHKYQQIEVGSTLLESPASETTGD